MNGTHPLGFKVTSLIDGQTFNTLALCRIILDVARELRKPGNSEFPGADAVGERAVTGEVVLFDDDSAGLRQVKQKAFTNTAIAMTFMVGTVAGNRWVWALTG